MFVKKKKNRFLSILLLLGICSLGVYIVLSNLTDNIVFFYPPSEIDKIKDINKKARVGGLVKQGSIKHIKDKKLLFTITDFSQEIEIEYSGVLPALFREGQGIVAEGVLSSPKLFIASKLLTKHDEKYMPPEINRKIKNH
ncbi:MAG: cytochrome c maturation protein CcmE [Rickettsiales bacterium]|nr:cytochrome c maturation protein CcmE [Rickettsiales bacterium]